MNEQKKKIVIWVIGIVTVVIVGVLLVMSRPLNLVYHHSDMGDFNVISDCSDNFLYKMTFTSFGTVTPEIANILPLLKPNLIVNNARMSGLSVHGRVNEPLVYEFRLRYGDNKFISCYQINQMMKEGFNRGIIQIEIDERLASKLK